MTDNFANVVASAKPTLVDFYATWCGPCKMMGPILENLAEQVGDKALIIKIDVDKNPKLATQLQIKGVPTLVLYKSGKIVWRQSGVVQVDQLRKLINQYQ